MGAIFKRFGALFLLLVFSVNSFAHEYWLEPDTFFPAVGEKINLKMYLGEGLKIEEERPYQAEKTVLFRHFFGKTSAPAKNNIDNSTPFYSYVHGGESGNHMFAVERDWSYITLEPAKFEDYLPEDGMEYIIAERAKLGEAGKDGRERYSRFIKALLQVGDKRDNTYKMKSGLKLDITPLENPYAKKVGDDLSFQINFEGKPLAGRTVFADNRDGESISKVKMVTDANGKIIVKLDRKGTWLIRLVVMKRCKAECNDTDWESFWGAYSFGVR